MNSRNLSVLLMVTLLIAVGCSTAQQGTVEFKQGKDKIDVIINGKNLTSYLYMNTLTKPVLYPVKTTSDTVLTRRFPMEKVEGETTDHPHHLGIFFTYDEVNDDGFWNNSTYPPQVIHVKTTQVKGGKDKGTLSTVMHWSGKKGDVLLEEKRDMTFIAGDKSYAIDFNIDLIAKTKIKFGDTKEGMFAIRTADWLMEKKGNTEYLSSNGDKKAGNIWGKRANWVTLQGGTEDKKLGIAIMNHPSSVNYPTYWHARDYGLFAANPLGQGAFQKAKKVPNAKPLGLTLEPGEKAHFRFLVIIYEGLKTADQLEKQYEKFIE